jgi:hypothetical protein
MSRRRRVLGLVVEALLAAAALPTAVRAHGASRGMHLHVPAESVAQGTAIEVDVDCAAPVVTLTIAFVGTDPLIVTPKVPAKHLSVSLGVPDAASTTINVVAEAATSTGKVLRASAIVRVGKAPGTPSRKGPASHDRVAPL